MPAQAFAGAIATTGDSHWKAMTGVIEITCLLKLCTCMENKYSLLLLLNRLIHTAPSESLQVHQC